MAARRPRPPAVARPPPPGDASPRSGLRRITLPGAANRCGPSRLAYREQHRDFGAEAEVLRPLPGVEAERRLALAGLMRRQPQQHVLDAPAAQLLRARRRGGCRVEP